MSDFLASLSGVIPGLNKTNLKRSIVESNKSSPSLDLDFFCDDFSKTKMKYKQSSLSNVKSSVAVSCRPQDLYESETDIKQIRHHNSIKVYSTLSDLPPPIQTFPSLYQCYTIPDYLQQNISSSPSFTSLTAIQMQAIPLIMEGHDVICGAPTGSGKTLAFLIPLIARLSTSLRKGFRALIVTPTKELAKQIYLNLHRLARTGNGSQTMLNCCMLTKDILEGFQSTPSSNFDVLISTPLLLVNAIKTAAVDLGNVEFLVFDEADRLLESGFLEQIDTILAACSSSSIQKCLFSATISSSVERMANSFMLSPIRIVVGSKSGASCNVKQELLFVGADDSGKKLILKQLLNDGKLASPCIIFVRSIERVEEVVVAIRLYFNELKDEETSSIDSYLPNSIVSCISAGMTSKDRDLSIDNFRSGKSWFLVATDVLARGLDFKNVQTILNYDCPEKVSTYVHRIGRSGRAGQDGRAITFFTQQDSDYLKAIANAAKESGNDVADWIFKLKKVSNSRVRQNKIQLARNKGRPKDADRKNIRKRQKNVDITKGTSANELVDDEEIDSDCA